MIDRKKIRQIELKMNQHLAHFNKMFRVGANRGHEDRVAGASTSTNVPPPPKYVLRKDHKAVLPGRERYGPKGRPVCGAREAPNSRFGHFLSMQINDYSDCEEHRHECLSSEELRAEFEVFNDYDDNVREGCKVVNIGRC